LYFYFTLFNESSISVTLSKQYGYEAENEMAYITGTDQPSLFISRQLTPQPGRPGESYTFFQKTGDEILTFILEE